MGSNDGLIRLNKFCAMQGFCSRREADRLIQDGKVILNGEVHTNPATRVDHQKDKVEFSFDVDRFQSERVYIMLNKPTGYVTSVNPDEGIPVFDLVDCGKKVFPIGRLDKDSSGLLLFTDDSSIPKKVIGQLNHCQKEYFVKVNASIPDGALDKLREGINLWGQKTKPAIINRIGSSTFKIILVEGKNRQIRRMCQKVGYSVVQLKRIRMHTIKLGTLDVGRWRYLKLREIDALKKLK